MNEIFTRKTKLPAGLKGIVIEDPAGDYNIYVADWLSPEAEREVLEHEHVHIRRGHLRSTASVIESELEATYYSSR